LFAHCRVATEEDKVKRSDEIQPFIEFLFDMNYHELPMNYHKLRVKLILYNICTRVIDVKADVSYHFVRQTL